MNRSSMVGLSLRLLVVAAIIGCLHRPAAAGDAEQDDGKLRIIAFGAHPDDCEFKIGGTAAKWAALGHHVKLVSVTNGDIGHWSMAGGPLAKRRTAGGARGRQEARRHRQILDIHDGELMPTLENRRTITRLIRQWKADLVLSHRPNDYHPDHRYTGVLVQDSAYMVAVPFFCPDTPPLKSNPVFLYYSDGFQKPNPFTADIAVSIDDAAEKKLAAADALVSQVYEGGALGSEESARSWLDQDPAARKAKADGYRRNGYARTADQHRDLLIKWYGQEKGTAVQYAEVFEICEYGRRPDRNDIRRLFPFFP